MLSLQSALMWGSFHDNASSPTEIIALAGGAVVYGNASSTQLQSVGTTATFGQFAGAVYTSHLSLREVDIDGRGYLISTGHYFQDALVYDTLGGATNIPTSFLGNGGLVEAIGSYQTAAGACLYTISRKNPGVEVWSGDMASGWQKRQSFTLPGWETNKALADMAVVGNHVYVASHGQNNLSSMRIGADGTLQAVSTIDVRDGLLVSRPSKIAHVEVGGQDYLVLTASGSNSISVVEVSAAGTMRVSDQIMDTLDTRFQTPGHLEAFTVAGRQFVLTSGGDKGLSIFAILPTGRLRHVFTIEDTLDITLDQITDTQVIVNQNTVEILVASASEAGLTRLVLNMSSTGVVTAGPGAHQGGAGNDIIGGDHGDNLLKGGAGDDLLLDGAGVDTLFGGAGADTFSMSADGERDYIRDFDRNADVIDLSAWGIRDKQPISYQPVSGGVEIRFGTEILSVGASDGQTIDLAALRPEWVKTSNAGVNIANRPTVLPVAVKPPTNPVPDPPKVLPNIDYIAAGSNARFGSDGPDVINGSAADEILSGEGLAGQADEDIGTIVRFYRAALDREPDPTGFSYFRAELARGLAAPDMVRVFLDSPEFQSRFPNVGHEDYIRLLYNNTLGRQPDQSGIDFWTNLLANQLSDRPSVFMGFVGSEELRNKMQTTTIDYSWAAMRRDIGDDVFRIYQATLDRAPDLGGFMFWTRNLTDGSSFDTIVNLFYNSNEFLTRFGITGTGRFIELLYNNILDRAPDAEGFAYHHNAITSGHISREGTVEFFAQSPEFQVASLPNLITWLRGQGGGDRLISNGGNDIMFGGILADSFIFDKNKPARAVIKDFEPWDFLELQGFDYLDGQEALDHVTAGPDGLVFSDQGVEITLLGLSPGDLTIDAFSVA